MIIVFLERAFLIEVFIMLYSLYEIFHQMEVNDYGLAMLEFI
jgi:hypothetical protein